MADGGFWRLDAGCWMADETLCVLRIPCSVFRESSPPELGSGGEGLFASFGPAPPFTSFCAHRACQALVRLARAQAGGTGNSKQIREGGSRENEKMRIGEDRQENLAAGRWRNRKIEDMKMGTGGDNRRAASKGS